MRWRVAAGEPGQLRVWTGKTFEDIEKYGEEKWLGELAEEPQEKDVSTATGPAGVDPEAGRGSNWPLGISNDPQVTAWCRWRQC